MDEGFLDCYTQLNTLTIYGIKPFLYSMGYGFEKFINDQVVSGRIADFIIPHIVSMGVLLKASQHVYLGPLT